MNQNCALVLDDHQLFGESFAVLLEKYTEIETVHTFQEVSELTRFLAQHSRKKFIVFLDYYLKSTNGLTVLTDIRRINKVCKTIFLTSTTSWTVFCNLQSHRPDAIINKSNGLDIILECIQTVNMDCNYLCPFFQELQAKNVNTEPITFTARELEILKFFAEGNTVIETAEKTFLSRHTIVSHRRNMMSKAKCTTISQLLAFATQWRLI